MASILDDLKGILGDDAIAKIEANGVLKAKVTRANELYTYYAGDDEEVIPAKKVEPEPARREVPGFDLSSVERMLDAKLGAKLADTVKASVEEAVKVRGDELYNSVRSGVRSDALQLVKIYTKHQQATGKDWDDAEEVKFNDFLKANNEAVKTGAGKQYRSITEAYNDYIAPVVQERTIAEEVDKRVKATSGQHVPGTTPAPSVNPAILAFRKRSATGDGKTSGAERAAALLDRRLSEQSA